MFFIFKKKKEIVREKPLKIVILGYGGRGKLYAELIKNLPKAYELVDIIDSNPKKLAVAKEECQLSERNLFSSLDEYLKNTKVADYMFVCTQDKEHLEHSLKALDAGYNLLLEKPIACSAEDCVAIQKKAEEKKLEIAVCHVLRYSAYYEKIKKIMDSGELGKIISIEQVENVGYWHQAHSFVRGDWRKTEINPMILAKCCHDLDIAVFLAGSECQTVTSSGKNLFFNSDNAPIGATKFCLGGCKAKRKCPYDCEKLYIEKIKHLPPASYKGMWPQSRVVDDGVVTLPKLKEALKSSQFGKCVFLTDNDVVDYQVTTMSFKNGIYSTLTMTAFSNDCYRETRIRGSLGELICRMDKNELIISIFGKKPYKVKTNKGLDFHGGGDKIMIEKLALGDIKTNVAQSVESHLIAFAAEKSRVNGGMPIDINSFRNIDKKSEENKNLNKEASKTEVINAENLEISENN